MAKPKNFIKSNDQIIVGNWYWCRSKTSGLIQCLKCETDGERKYVGSRIWAFDQNSQALAKYDMIEAKVPFKG